MGLTNPGVVRISASDSTFTGTVRVTGGPNITVGTDAQGISISGAAGGGGNFSGGVSTAGNTAGATGITGTRLVFVGTNNITLSQTTDANGGTISISGAGAGGGQFSGGVSTLGNTLGSTGITGTRLVFAGGNNITLSQSTDANGGTVTVSAANETQTFVGGVAASNTTYTSGTITITGVGGGITVSSNTGQRVDLSVAPQSVQTQGILSAGVSTGGNTAGNTTVNTGSRLVIVGAGDITASQSTVAGASTVTLSGPTQSVQTQGILSAGVSTGGNTAGNTTVNTGSRLVIVGAGDITASQSTVAGASTITLSSPAQSVQTQDVLSVGVSTGGNTLGNTTVNTGSRMVFAGINNITLSASTAAGASTISISGPNINPSFSAGVSTAGNTAGSTGISGTRMVLVGTNNITLSQSTDANGNTISISGAGGGAGQFSGGASNLGNTAGATGITGTRLVLVGSNNITLSQTTDANGGTLSIIGGAGGGGLASAGFSTQGNTSGNTSMATSIMQIVGGNNITLSGGTAAGNVTITISAPNTTNFRTYSNYDPTFGEQIVEGQQGQGTLHIQPMWEAPDIQFDRIVFGLRGSHATGSTGSVTLSMWLGAYTKNASTLSLSTSWSGSQGITFSGTANSTILSGPKLFTMGATGTLSANDYWIGIISRTTSGGANMSLSQYLVSQINSNWSGIWGVASNATDQYRLGLGAYTATTTAMPASIAFSQINGTASLVLRRPKVAFVSGTA